MLHEKTPDEDGWYWIHEFGQHGSDMWYMAYLTAENYSRPMLCVIDADGTYFGVEHYKADKDGEFRPERSCTIKHWIGPLSCPGGELGQEIAEFTLERHQEANRSGKSMVMVHADVRKRKGAPGCRITQTGLLDGDEAYRVGSLVFN